MVQASKNLKQNDNKKERKENVSYCRDEREKSLTEMVKSDPLEFCK